jgi:hypothetical protein
MSGSALADGAMLVASIAVLCVGMAALLLVWRKAFDRITLKAGSVEASLEAVGKMTASLDAVKESVEQINTAVNHVPRGSPTLVQRVTDTEAKVDYLVRAVEAIGQHVGCSLEKAKEKP